MNEHPLFWESKTVPITTYHRIYGWHILPHIHPSVRSHIHLPHHAKTNSFKETAAVLDKLCASDHTGSFAVPASWQNNVHLAAGRKPLLFERPALCNFINFTNRDSSLFWNCGEMEPAPMVKLKYKKMSMTTWERIVDNYLASVLNTEQYCWPIYLSTIINYSEQHCWPILAGPFGS